MADIQRYGDNPWAYGADPEFGPREDGDFVTYEDHKKIVEELERKLALAKMHNQQAYYFGKQVGMRMPK